MRICDVCYHEVGGRIVFACIECNSCRVDLCTPCSLGCSWCNGSCCPSCLDDLDMCGACRRETKQLDKKLKVCLTDSIEDWPPSPPNAHG